MTHLRIFLYCLGCAALLLCTSPVAEAASKEQVQGAIDRGLAFLRKGFAKAPEGHKGLIALTLMKAGLPHDAPEIKEAIELARKKCAGGTYKHGGEHYYEAGVDATLLADSGEECKAELEAIAKFIIDLQNPNGGWNYPGEGEADSGDTSTIQYCCLALWAADRVGVEIDPQVWVKVIDWHARYQSPDGGFAYRPGTSKGDGMGATTLNMTVNSVGSIHIAMLHLDPGAVPFMEKPAPAAVETPAGTKPKGALEVVDLERKQEAKAKAEIPGGARPTIMKAYGWLSNRFRVSNEPAINRMYYYYSLERMAALADIKKIGSHDWFNECADYVIQKQLADGSWKESNFVTLTAEIDTCFAVLFLTRSTGKLLKRTEPAYGDGLLAGGRGLPDDLSGAKFNGRSMEDESKKPTGPLDELFAALGNVGDIDISEVQEQIVEKIQIGDRAELIKQKELLVKLVKHSDPSIRMTAMWALGRTDDMRLAQHLVSGLDDNDVGVMIEANSALCWLARKPRGFGFPLDPLESLGPNPAAEAKAQAIRDWNKGVVMAWGQWYLDNRPYEDRGDDFEALLRRRMQVIKEQP